MSKRLEPTRVLGWLLLGVVGLLFRLFVLLAACAVMVIDVLLLWRQAPSYGWRLADGLLFAAAALVAWYVGLDAIGARTVARLLGRRHDADLPAPARWERDVPGEPGAADTGPVGRTDDTGRIGTGWR
jgi:hypothetical protein